MRSIRFAALLVTLTAVSACGTAAGDDGSGGAGGTSPSSSAVVAPGTAPPESGLSACAIADPLGELPFGLTRCTEPVLPSADPTYYRDEPVYVGDEMPIDEVRAWAEDQPGYAEIWIDRAHNGWVTVGFNEGAAARQADLVEAFPAVGVVAIDVAFGQAELDQLASEVVAVAEQEGVARIGVRACRTAR